MHIKHPEKSEAQQKADEVRVAHEIEWLMRPGIELVATMRDTEGNYFVAVGVRMLGIDYKIPSKIDNVPIRVMNHLLCNLSSGATDISFPIGSERTS